MGSSTTERVARGSVEHGGALGRRVSRPMPEGAAPSLPLGRRSPRGQKRWYLVACPEGREQATCQRMREILPSELLEDSFVPRRERQRKYHGKWVTSVVDMFPGYFVAATKDAPALSRALGKLSFPARLVGAVGRGYQPIAQDAMTFLIESMDSAHVVRCSEGEIVSDQLHVLWGPLKGKESRVARVVRGKSMAMVRVGESDGAESLLVMPLAIPVRR